MTDTPSTPPTPPETPTPASRNQPPVHFSRPKPLPLPKRFVLLLVEPEKWAHAAVYPVSVTFWPLVWAIIIGALCLGFSLSANSIKPLQVFANSYDQYYLPMVLNHGQLAMRKPPGKTKLVPLYIPNAYETVMVNTSLTGASALQTKPLIWLFNRTDLVLTGTKVTRPMVVMPLAKLQREMLLAVGTIKSTALKTTPVDKLPAVQIDSQTLQKFFTVLAPVVVLMLGLLASLFFVITNVLWTVLMVFLTGFLVMSINRNIGMPLKAAWRISMAVMIPLLVLRGLLAVFNLVPVLNNSPIIDQIIYMAPIGLSLWAAILANRLFSKPRAGGRL
ncbi:MAG: hypothetical protein ACP5VQ_03075 [Phycisphaerae bacterium]